MNHIKTGLIKIEYCKTKIIIKEKQKYFWHKNL